MSAAAGRAAAQPRQQVEFEMMTWPEVKAALAAGKTTALIYTGGTEHRGPQNVNGGHNLMARETVKAIALKLGNAIALPVLPYTPNNASAALPGTIGLTNEILAAVLERISEQAIVNGFKNVILMGDHGGGQGTGERQPNVYREVARKLDDEVRAAGHPRLLLRRGLHEADGGLRRVPQVAEPAGRRPRLHSGHLRDAVSRRRQRLGAEGARSRRPSRRRAGSPATAISGDGRASTEALGKRVFDMKIEYAVRQIQALLAAPKPQG